MLDNTSWVTELWTRVTDDTPQSPYHIPGVYLVPVTDEDKIRWPMLVDLTEVRLYKDAVGIICSIDD